MNREQRDKGLRKAMEERPRFRLPSNFVYLTMQKVEENMLLRERQAERKTLWATVAASLFLIAGGFTYIFFLWGEAIRKTFEQGMVQTENSITFFPASYLLFIAAILILLFFDRWMRKRYFRQD